MIKGSDQRVLLWAAQLKLDPSRLKDTEFQMLFDLEKFCLLEMI